MALEKVKESNWTQEDFNRLEEALKRVRDYEKVMVEQILPVSDKVTEDIKCLHLSCPTCNGTGIRKDGLGMCIHGISCPCPRCSTYGSWRNN